MNKAYMVIAAMSIVSSYSTFTLACNNNGVIDEADEICDGGSWAGANLTCGNFQYHTGNMGCSNCQPDTSACGRYVCQSNACVFVNEAHLASNCSNDSQCGGDSSVDQSSDEAIDQVSDEAADQTSDQSVDQVVDQADQVGGPATCDAPNKICGNVWAGETYAPGFVEDPISGVVVEYRDSNGVWKKSTKTNAAGYFEFVF